jgi:chemotaxis protein methyltransferase CheR
MATAVQNAVPSWSRATLGKDEFDWLAGVVRESCGIALTPGKRSMLEGRLRRRLRAHELDSFADYVSLLKNPEIRLGELQELVDAVTTNQTSFFREPAHFEYLAGEGLARLLPDAVGRPLRAWSAACSSGEECYTLAMVLAEAAPERLAGGFSILGTDISVTMLRKASRAIYREADVQPVPKHLQARYLLRARDKDLSLVRIAPELRRLARFGQLNLTDRTYRLDHPQDLIFCRNVLIYFEPRLQHTILQQLCRHLRPGGILCLGHADTTSATQLPLRLLRANIYERL